MKIPMSVEDLPAVVVNGRRVLFPTPLMWQQKREGYIAIQHRSEVDERDDLEFFSKEQLIDFALAYAEASKGTS